MKNLFTTFKFELYNFFESKSYTISTLLIAIVIAVVMFLPNFIDLGLEKDTQKTNSDSEQAAEEKEEDKTKYIYFDESGAFISKNDLNEITKSQNIEWIEAKNVDELKKQIEDDKYNYGFVIKSNTEYDYYVFNKEMFDEGGFIMDEIMASNYQSEYCAQNDIEFEKIAPILEPQIEKNSIVLGKDAADSYWYCYIFVILVFMLIIIYGVMIATAVTNEKSNRSIEVLVTSTSSHSLLFGKVLAGTVASFLQVALIMIIAIGGYKINEAKWGNALDMILKIDSNVLIVFALFGITGFVFYAFAYGAVGALVSKTEDINKSAGSIQMIIMVVYFAVLMQMNNIDGVVMKVASFLPISSYSAMFIRVAMGEVALWEIIISYIILVISTIAMGFLGSKIYRMGTLQYGNPIKITTALKSIRRKEND